MNIKKISTEQFAGITDKDISLDSGINVILGENETGKSTMVEVLYQTLFTDADVAKNSVIKKNYIPNRADNVKVSIIDGVIRFETDDGAYKLKKEWVAGAKGAGQVRLSLPDGTIVTDKDEVNRILGQILQYGSGVYSEIVFNSQKRESAAVRCIMGDISSKDTVIDDLGTTLKQAQLETGGVSINAMEKKIDENIEQLGFRWDFSADCPEKRRGINDPWFIGKDNNGILKAFYERETIKQEYNRVMDVEGKLDAINKRISDARAKHDQISNKLASFNRCRAVIEKKSHHEDIIKTNIAQRKERFVAFQNWPENVKSLELAKDLRTRLEVAVFKDKYDRVNTRFLAYQDAKKQLESATPVDSNDYKNAREMEKSINYLQSQLCDMNISAKISKLSEQYKLQIITVATGEEVLPVDGNYIITEAVRLIIPDVIEVELAPSDVDVDEITKQLNDNKNALISIYAKYNVETSDDIKTKMDLYNQIVANCDRMEKLFSDALENDDWDKLQENAKKLPADIESLKDLSEKVYKLCGSSSIDGFIGAKTSMCKQYEEKYVSMDSLKSLIEENDAVISRTQQLIDTMEVIPTEFESIDNPDRFAKELESKVKEQLAYVDKINEEKNEIASTLGDKSSMEYKAEYDSCDAEFNHRKLMYSRWLDIKAKFNNLKTATGGTDISDIESNFKKYLDIISAGKIEIMSMDEKLGVSIKSGKNKLTAENLSGGTKELISLAFRLSMLEHIFPDGNGFTVFDDPFVNMSDERAGKACELIKEFAKNNQVIFVTCHPKYHDMLGGELIAFK